MTSKEFSALYSSECSKQSNALLNGEWNELPASSHLTEAEALDAEPIAESLDLPRSGLRVSSHVLGVDAGIKVPVIHNAFFIPGKVPSLNELLDARASQRPTIRSLIMREKPQKGKQRGAQFSKYHEIKKDWEARTIRALGTPFIRVPSCYFGYVVVEETLKRDPSNICSAAVKFIEDGLVLAGVIPNDGWDQVLGIRVTWIHRKGQEPGVYVVMSDTLLPESTLIAEYEDHLLSFI